MTELRPQSIWVILHDLSASRLLTPLWIARLRFLRHHSLPHPASATHTQRHSLDSAPPLLTVTHTHTHTGRRQRTRSSLRIRFKQFFGARAHGNAVCPILFVENVSLLADAARCAHLRTYRVLIPAIAPAHRERHARIRNFVGTTRHVLACNGLQARTHTHIATHAF